MKLQHRVVTIYQNLKTGNDERETVGAWISPAEAEVLSDKAAQDLEDDSVRYVLIEANRPEHLSDRCEWQPSG